jgi:hypothetical protein
MPCEKENPRGAITKLTGPKVSKELCSGMCQKTCRRSCSADIGREAKAKRRHEQKQKKRALRVQPPAVAFFPSIYYKKRETGVVF